MVCRSFFDLQCTYVFFDLPTLRPPPLNVYPTAFQEKYVSMFCAPISESAHNPSYKQVQHSLLPAYVPCGLVDGSTALQHIWISQLKVWPTCITTFCVADTCILHILHVHTYNMPMWSLNLWWRAPQMSCFEMLLVLPRNTPAIESTLAYKWGCAMGTYNMAHKPPRMGPSIPSLTYITVPFNYV